MCGCCSSPSCNSCFSDERTIDGEKDYYWVCKLTGEICLATDSSKTFYFEDAERCPGYNLPKSLASLVGEFRKVVGVPLTFFQGYNPENSGQKAKKILEEKIEGNLAKTINVKIDELVKLAEDNREKLVKLK